jgi:hypothetical protein
MRVPTPMPPTDTQTKSTAPRTTVRGPTPPDVPAERMMMNSTIPVASLNKLSPSTRTDSRSGALRSLKRATTATGSVAEISAPNSRAALQERGVTAATMLPTMAVDTIISGNAKSTRGYTFCLSSRRSS